MEQYIIGLFQNMSLLTMVLLGAGILLCVIEVFVPKVGLTGVLGMVLLACGLSSYHLDGFKVKQLVSLMAIIALILALFIMIELILEGRGVIRNPNRYKFRTYEAKMNLKDMIGKFGKAITNIDLGGTIEIDGNLYYAISDVRISSDRIVEVIGVQNNALVVKVK